MWDEQGHRTACVPARVMTSEDAFALTAAALVAVFFVLLAVTFVLFV